MGQKGIIKDTMIEGYVDAKDSADIFHSLIGKNGVLDYKERLAIEKINDNTIRVRSGVYNLDGHIIIVDNYLDLKIENGSLGLQRYDLMIAEYVKNGESIGTDTLEFKVLRGIPTSSNPEKPTLTYNDTVKQEALAVIKVNGVELEEINSNEVTVIYSNSNFYPKEQTYSKKEIDTLFDKQLITVRHGNNVSIAAGHQGIIKDFELITHQIGEELQLITGSGSTPYKGGIRIGKGISKIIMNGWIFINGEHTTGSGQLKIYKNGQQVDELSYCWKTGFHRELPFSGYVMDVLEGDYLQLFIASTSKGLLDRTRDYWTVEKAV